jgi:hypothetical protein
MIGISARPAGSSQIKLHRLPMGAEGAKCLFLAFNRRVEVSSRMSAWRGEADIA